MFPWRWPHVLCILATKVSHCPKYMHVCCCVAVSLKKPVLNIAFSFRADWYLLTSAQFGFTLSAWLTSCTSETRQPGSAFLQMQAGSHSGSWISWLDFPRDKSGAVFLWHRFIRKFDIVQSASSPPSSSHNAPRRQRFHIAATWAVQLD